MKKLIKIIAVILAVAIALTVAVMPLFSVSAEEGKLNYLLLGDSIGFGAGIVNPDEACYGKIVADTNGYNYKNCCVSGYNSTALLAHMLLPAVKDAVEEADIISLSIGGNDFLTSNMVQLGIEAGAFNNLATFDKIAENFYENYCKIIGKIRELNPDAVILAQTLYNPMHNALNEIYQAGADRLNAVYHRYLKENPGSIVIVDVGKAFEGHPEFIADDCVHPNSIGNEIIAKLVLKTLKDLGLGKTDVPVIAVEGMDFGIYKPFKFAIDSIVAVADFFMPWFFSVTN